MEEKILRVSPSYEAQYRDGYPLVMEEALTNPGALKEEGEVFRLETKGGDFLGRGYHGRQNKGLGWIVTTKETETIDERLIQKRLIVALGRRGHFFGQEETNLFRLFNGEGDGFGGVLIDYYDRWYVIQFYSRGAYAFKDVFVEAILQNTDAIGVYEKKRFSDGGAYVADDDFVTGTPAPEPLPVKENGMTFASYLNDGAMTGIFLDQRDVRRKVRDELADGRNVLNTFSYTGAFSVAAALGGAATTNIDAANRSREKTIEQFRMNGVDPAAHDIIVDDVFQYLKRSAKREKRWDLVILDPPSFARTKQTTFKASKDYPSLLVSAAAVTETGGYILASTNHGGMTHGRFRKFIKQAAAEADCTFKVESVWSVPEDVVQDDKYPEGSYLKVYLIKKIAEGGASHE
ncbi:class I SAM-dependent rRNA methyltransferase [Alkalicoccus chagannorensis]|uniref:class I SAM-dependent rRNA methyltransferase n=1 Tax=Alkalicoccus chagannorensis TaxID=427072 RepID=UPI00041E3433|nr:class I SAM-dependent rRNA methyltransferase [Alkalicoccus chagannorensis]